MNLQANRRHFLQQSAQTSAILVAASSMGGIHLFANDKNYPFTSYGLHGFDNGNVFYGTDGYMVFSRRGAFSVFQGPKGTPGPTEGKELRGQRGYAEHMTEFLAAVRQRTPTKASAAVAHRSCALVHLGEIAYRTRGRLDFDRQTQRFIDCDEANTMLSKKYREPYGLPESLT
jgi:predicted dehydrogenase